MVYSGSVRSFVQAAAVCALALSTLPSTTVSSAVTTCSSSPGDKKFGIQAIDDATCAKGGLGCYNNHCRYCKVLDTPKSSHLDTCLSHGVAFTATAAVVVTQGPCEVSSGDVAAGISAVTDSGCLYGGLGCYNDHCRFCKVVETPHSSGFMACSTLDSSYSTPVASTAAPATVASSAPVTVASATAAPTVAVVEVPATAARTIAVVEVPATVAPIVIDPVTQSPAIATDTPPVAVTDAPSVVAMDVPVTDAPDTSVPAVVTTDAPAPQTICTVVPAAGDLDVGVTIVTDVSCAAGGLGCLSDVCRFCKLKTTPQSDPYMDCTLVNATSAVVDPATTPDATTEIPSVTSSVAETEAPGTTTTDAPIATNDASTETPASAAVDNTTEAPVATTATPVDTTETPASTTAAPVDDTTEAPTATTVAPVDATTEAPTATAATSVDATEAPASTTAAPADVTEAPISTTEAPDASTEVPDATTETPVSTAGAPDATTDAPVVTTDETATEPPAPTTCSLVASAEDAGLGISVATDPSCSLGGVGCIDKICRFCKVTTSLQSAPYIDCALLEDGWQSVTETPDATTDAPATTTETPVVPADNTDATTDARTDAPGATAEAPANTDTVTETPTSDSVAPDTVTEVPAAEIPSTTTEAPAISTNSQADQEVCGIVAAAGDVAVGVHIATDPTCSAGGLGCINDLCRFCKVETTPQSEAFVDCASLGGFTTDSEAPADATSSPATSIPVTPQSCGLVASSGDSAVGIRIVTDSACSVGGVGCISDVCRFCKVTTSVQSAAFLDCVTVDGYTPEKEAPVASATPDATTGEPVSEATCTLVSSGGDIAVGVDIATDSTCASGGVGCIDKVCRFCQVTPTVQSAAFVNCTSLSEYRSRSEAPADTATATPSASSTEAPVAQASCGLVVSTGDAAVGISITGDATCAAGGVGCIDNVCRFCKVKTTVQSAAFVDCTSIAEFTPATDAPADATVVPIDATTASAPAASGPASTCSLAVSEGDAAVGIDITADSTCQFGGVGCIDNVCRFCKVKTTEQSSAFVDCPVAVGSTVSSNEPVTTPALPGDTTSEPVNTSTAGTGVPSDSSTTETPATDAPTETPDSADGTLPVTEAPAANQDITETPATTSATDVPDATPDAPTATTGATVAATAVDDDNSDKNPVATSEQPTDSVTEAPDATSATADSRTDSPTDAPNSTVGAAVTEAPSVDTSDLLTDAPAVTTEAPTKAPAPTVDDIDDNWEGSDSESDTDSDSTYFDSEESSDGI
ncbi:unnamed protein product [Phytophthora lilii]|uniref:Unnamed protein product n=1 Tax=Phytophthora lilii TaxID=2077276 RepID=A0A9W6U8N8_9STRA|nr:unnamed protein product [Phytophthora lilii]